MHAIQNAHFEATVPKIFSKGEKGKKESSLQQIVVAMAKGKQSGLPCVNSSSGLKRRLVHHQGVLWSYHRAVVHDTVHKQQHRWKPHNSHGTVCKLRRPIHE
jgi:hypothetical protein